MLAVKRSYMYSLLARAAKYNVFVQPFPNPLAQQIVKAVFAVDAMHMYLVFLKIEARVCRYCGEVVIFRLLVSQIFCLPIAVMEY